MIDLLRISSGRNQIERIREPKHSDLETVFSYTLRGWTGCVEMFTDDCWCLVLFIQDKNFHLGIQRDEKCVYFLKNDGSLPDDGYIQIAWHYAPSRQVVQDASMIRQCVLNFFLTGRPRNDIQYEVISTDDPNYLGIPKRQTKEDGHI